MTWKHFKPNEVVGLKDDLVSMLDEARDICGFPFVITSGYRSPEKNAEVGGARDSAHEKGEAVDLQAPVGQDLRQKMAWALGAVGFKRIGLYDKHIHVDISKDKPQKVAWFGTSH